MENQATSHLYNSQVQHIIFFRPDSGWGRTFGVSRTGQKGQNIFRKRAIPGTKQGHKVVFIEGEKGFSKNPFSKGISDSKTGLKRAKGLSGPTLQITLKFKGRFQSYLYQYIGNNVIEIRAPRSSMVDPLVSALSFSKMNMSNYQVEKFFCSLTFR